MIEKMIQKKERVQLQSEIYSGRVGRPNNDQKWCCLTYIGKGTEQVSGTLKREGYKVAYKPTINLKRLLSRPKDAIPAGEKSGVYSVRCGSCPATYVGKTGRRLTTRISEHKPSSSKQSHLKDHINKTNHEFSEENVSLLHAINEGPRLAAFEKLEILKCKKRSGDMCLNVQTDFQSDLLELVARAESRRDRPGW